ncbi:MAG: O-antigen ligase family protein, partial [Acidimicrobiia bacterium]
TDRTRPRWRRDAAGFAAAGGVVTLLGSGARAAWLGAMVAVAWAMVMLWRNGHLRSTVAIAGAGIRRRRITIAAMIGAGLCALVALGAVGASTGVDNRITDMFDRSEPGGISRIDDWTVGWSTLIDHPILGVGPEGYRTEAAAHVSATYERRHGRAVMIDRAHSGPLDIALVVGVPGLLLFGALVMIVARAIIARFPSMQRHRQGCTSAAIPRSTLVMFAAVASLIAYGAQQLLLFPLAELDPVAWSLAGAVVGALTNESLTPISDRRRRPTSILATSTVVVIASGVLTIGMFGVVADRQAQSALDALGDLRIADAQHRAAEAADLRPDVIVLQLLESRAWAAGSSDDELRRAVEAAERAARLSSRDPAVAAEVARTRSRLAASTRRPADIAAADDQWQFVLTLDPHNAALLADRGRFAAEFGDAVNAVRFLTEAADLAPRDPEPLIDLARIAIASGRRDEAITLARAAETRAASDRSVLQLLVDLELTPLER